MAKTKIEVDLVIKGGESVEQVESKTKSLKAQLKEMKTLLASGTLDSNSFNKLAAEAGELQDRIGDVSDKVKTLASDSQKLDTLMSAAQGLVGGFAAVQGITAMLGEENEDLQKTMVKLQGAMSALAGIEAVVNSLKAENALITGLVTLKTVAQTVATRVYTFVTGQATVATRALNATMAALGGGFLIILGAIIANWSKIKSAISGVSQEIKDQIVESKKHLDVTRDQMDAFTAQENSLRLQGISEREILKLKIKKTQETINASVVALRLQEQENKAAYEGEVRNKKFLKSALDFIIYPISSLLKAVDALMLALGQAATYKDNFADMISNLAFDPDEMKANGEAANKELSKSIDELVSQRDGYELKIKDIDKQAADTASALSLKNQEELAAKEKKLQEGIAAEKLKKQEALIEVIKELSTKQALNNLSERDKEIQILNDSYIAKMELAKGNSDLEAELLKQKTFEITQIADKYRKEEAEKAKKDGEDKLAADKKLNAERLQNLKDVETARMSIVNDSYLALNALGELALGQQFKNTNAGKALALAQIATDTALGFIQGLRIAQQSAIGLSGPAAAFTMPVFYASQVAAVLGAANKAKSILGGGGSTSAPSNSGGGGGGSMSSQPPRMDTFQSNRTPMNANQRVYVLEKDITDSQGRVARIRHNATLI
jgi:hypothetical protein